MRKGYTDMVNFEQIKRKAQNAAYVATEKAQEAAVTAGEKAGVFLGIAGEKVGALKELAEKKAALLAEKNSLAKNYQALGEWYAAQCGEDVPEEIEELMGLIRASEEKIAALTADKEVEEDVFFDEPTEEPDGEPAKDETADTEE